MKFVKVPIKNASWRRRTLGNILTCNDRISIRVYNGLLLKTLYYLNRSEIMRRENESLRIKFKRFAINCYFHIRNLALTDGDFRTRCLPIVERKYITIDSLKEDTISHYFRFKSKEDLKRLFLGFQFSELYTTRNGHKYFGEEVFLIGLYRLHFPNTTGDVMYLEMFGMYHQRVSECFGIFLRHMMLNWSYLLLDNMNYWRESIPAFSEVIRKTIFRTHNCEFEPNNFCIFGFIDNTMNAMCRPGGGPVNDGVNAPRNDPDLQRAWYNGWKKVHGMKYQTIDLPNGMNFHVYGPVSVRHNDLYTLHNSGIDDLLTVFQQGYINQYCVYGDSAYTIFNLANVRARHNNEVNTLREILENKAMSSARQTIEWDYGDVSKMWATLSFSKVLKMRRMPVSSMYITAMILRNAHNTMYGGNTAVYFNCTPPPFEHWISQGPRYFQNNNVI